MQHNNPEPASRSNAQRRRANLPGKILHMKQALPKRFQVFQRSCMVQHNAVGKIRERLRFHPFFCQSTAQARRVNPAGIDPYKQRRMASHPPQKRFRIFFGILILPKFNQRPGNRIGQRKPTSPSFPGCGRRISPPARKKNAAHR